MTETLDVAGEVNWEGSPKGLGCLGSKEPGNEQEGFLAVPSTRSRSIPRGGTSRVGRGKTMFAAEPVVENTGTMLALPGVTSAGEYRSAVSFVPCYVLRRTRKQPRRLVDVSAAYLTGMSNPPDHTLNVKRLHGESANREASTCTVTNPSFFRKSTEFSPSLGKRGDVNPKYVLRA